MRACRSHLNNAPLTANRLFEADFYDVARVEVLRGPQGTLYGRNATGGVVNVISQQPGPDFEASLKGEWGNFDEQRYTAVLNLPLGQNLGLRIAATSLDRDGYGHNNTLHRDIDGRDILGRPRHARVATDRQYQHLADVGALRRRRQSRPHPEAIVPNRPWAD